MLNLAPGSSCTVIGPNNAWKVSAIITHLADGWAYTSTGHRVSTVTGFADRTYGDQT